MVSASDFSHGEYGYGLYFSKYPSKAAQFSAVSRTAWFEFRREKIGHNGEVVVDDVIRAFNDVVRAVDDVVRAVDDVGRNVADVVRDRMLMVW